MTWSFPSSREMTPRSNSMRTNSSAYSGLPPDRSTTIDCSFFGNSVSWSSPAISSEVSSAVSGESANVVEFRLPPPHPGCASYSSGRAVQTTRSGTPEAHSTRCSMKSSIAASAQCRSSKTRIVVRCMASASRKRRHAVNASVRSTVESSSIAAPTSGARRARTQSRSVASWIRSPSAAASLSPACAGVSVSRIPACAFTSSPRAQNVMPSPYGRHRPWRHCTISASSSTKSLNSLSSRLLPTPGSPMTVASWIDCSRVVRQ